MSPLNFFFGHGDAEKTGDNLSRIAMGNAPRSLENLSECCLSYLNINTSTVKNFGKEVKYDESWFEFGESRVPYLRLHKCHQFPLLPLAFMIFGWDFCGRLEPAILGRHPTVISKNLWFQHCADTEKNGKWMLCPWKFTETKQIYQWIVRKLEIWG